MSRVVLDSYENSESDISFRKIYIVVSLRPRTQNTKRYSHPTELDRSPPPLHHITNDPRFTTTTVSLVNERLPFRRTPSRWRENSASTTTAVWTVFIWRILILYVYVSVCVRVCERWPLTVWVIPNFSDPTLPATPTVRSLPEVRCSRLTLYTMLYSWPFALSSFIYYHSTVYVSYTT